MNVLVFHLEVDFGEDIDIVANNELDLIEYLEKEHNFSDIQFSDVTKPYGTCSFKNNFYNTREVAKCFYSKKI
jgi:hypothetical protein